MKGVFKTPFSKYVYSLFFILSGSAVAVRFALWGIDSARAGKVAAAIFCFFFVFCGLVFGSFAIFAVNYNRGAYLTVEGGKINARFGWGSEIHADASSVLRAEPGRDNKSVELVLIDRVCMITCLENARDVCIFICSAFSDKRPSPSPVDAETALKNARKKSTVSLILTALFVILSFAHVGWCVLLTGGKDLGDFSSGENLIFTAFAAAELITVTLALFFANRCGKQRKTTELCYRTLITASATEHKSDSLDGFPNLIDVKFFDGYAYRVVIFSPEEDVYAYMLERFDPGSLTWEKRYGEERIFPDRSMLYEDLKICFDNVIFDE